MTIYFILPLIFLLRERRKLWVDCITAMHANCITALTKWVFYFPFSYLQQFNRVILGLAWDDVRKTKRGGQRGYEGLSIKTEPRGDSPVLNLAEDRCWKGLRTPPPLSPIEVIMFYFGIIQSPLHTNPDMFNWNHENCFTQTWSGFKLTLENS